MQLAVGAATATSPAGINTWLGPVTAPTGTATLTWTPNNSTDLGPKNLEVEVRDVNAYPGGAHTTKQTISLMVLEKNFAPTIISSPVLSATNGVLYNYDVNATDPNTTVPNNRIRYYLQNKPSGMTIDNITGMVSWNPTVPQALAGTAAVTVEARDQGVHHRHDLREPGPQHPTGG
jgi:hypothetical protein